MRWSIVDADVSGCGDVAAQALERQLDVRGGVYVNRDLGHPTPSDTAQGLGFVVVMAGYSLHRSKYGRKDECKDECTLVEPGILLKYIPRSATGFSFLSWEWRLDVSLPARTSGRTEAG